MPSINGGKTKSLKFPKRTAHIAVILVAISVFLTQSARALPAVEPIPESQQAALAMKILDTYQAPIPGKPPKKLHVVYYTPAGREPEPRYRERLEPLLEDIRAFYREGLQEQGFRPEGFALDRDTSGKLAIHLVRGKEPESAFPEWEGRNGGNTGAPEGGQRVRSECRPALEAAGISFEHETVLIFCNLATWDEKAKTFRHHSPYFGTSDQASGLCFVMDSVIQNLDDLTKKEPVIEDAEWGRESLGKFNTIFIGGIAHELGHAFSLPHCGERWDEKARGTSLMGAGNHTYREERRGEGKGTFLAMASAMRLAGRPLFSGSSKGETDAGQMIEQCDLLLSTNITRADLAGRRGRLRLEGAIQGSPPIYGVIAYFDSLHDGGYHAPTATSVPDAQGRFAIEVSDLASCASGDLRIEFCHANGAVSSRRLAFSVGPDGALDLTQWEMRRALEPIAQAVADRRHSAAEAALRELEAGPAPVLAKDIARKLAATLEDGPKPSPADAPANLAELPLGDARAQTAEVGWAAPAANRMPVIDGILSPLLDCGKLYATGLYAHSPSRYTYELGEKWQRLRGEAGLHTLEQSYAAGVVFIIKADGKEVYRSRTIRGPGKASYDVKLAGVKVLDLIVEKAGDQNGNNWSLWLEPTLSR